MKSIILTVSAIALINLSACAMQQDNRLAQASQYFDNTVTGKCGDSNIDKLGRKERLFPILLCRQDYFNQLMTNAGWPPPPLLLNSQVATLQLAKNFDDKKIDKEQFKIESAKIGAATQDAVIRQVNTNAMLEAAANQAAMQNMQNINMQNSQRLMNSVTPIQPLVRTPVQCFSNRMGSSIATNCY